VARLTQPMCNQTRNRVCGLKKQRGMSLIELMIAGLLSIIIGMIVIEMMASANVSNNRVEGVTQAQQNGRFAIHWLSDSIAKAGYSPFSTVKADSMVMGACGGTATPPAASAHCSRNNNDSPDQIAIQRVSDNGTSCAGLSLEDLGVDEEDLVVDVYWVERDSGDGSDLYDDLFRCATYTEGGTLLDSAQTLSSGIEDLQILYAIDGGTTFEPLDNISDVSAIKAIRFAVLARGYSDAVVWQGQRRYLRLDADALDYSDGAPRFVFENTVYLQNYENITSE